MKKLLSGIFVLLLVGMFAGAFNVQPAKADESVGAGSRAVSTIGATVEFRCTRNIIKVGGYYFCFYISSTDYHLVCRSSSDGVNWNPEEDVSDSALAQTVPQGVELKGCYGVFTDGTNVLVGFYNGTDSPSDMTATSFYIRNGTQSGGIITWSTAIKIAQGGGCSYHGFSFCKTSAGYYWVSFCYVYTSGPPWYCICVYNSSDLSSWNLSLNSISPFLVTSGYCSETQITYDPRYSNGVMLVADPYGPGTFGYTVFDNNEWLPPSTFASKTPNNFDYSGWSLATGNNQIQFVCVPVTWSSSEDAYIGGPLSAYNYTSSWSNGISVDISTCWGPSLTAYNSTTMYLFYYNDSLSAVYYRALTYSTMAWSGPKALVTGETLVNPSISYPQWRLPVLSEQNPPGTNIGVVWGVEVSSYLFYVRFTWLSLSAQASLPVAEFTVSPETTNAGEALEFNASSSIGGWNGTQTMPIVSYNWNFGDNNTANGQVVTHSYALAENYTVTLNVTDSQGLWDVAQRQIQVSQTNGPVAAFTVSPETGLVGEAVEFNASSSIEGWNGTTVPIIEYLWSFGDGNTTSTNESVVAHSYAKSGVFNATLTILDANGMYSFYSANVSVVMPTFVSVSTSSTSVLGSAVGINGTLQDAYGNGLENESVMLFYTFPGLDLWYPISSDVTDSLGNYYVQWIPQATGYFIIKAEWTGNATFSQTSETTMLSTLPYQNQYVFSVESNSTISELAFNTTGSTLSFTASGPSGTTGYTKVTVAKSLVANPVNIAVYLDGNQTDYAITSTDDSWLLAFNYTHSTHQVLVDLNTEAIPEFPPMMILPLLVLLAMIVSEVLRKRKGRAEKTV